MACIMQCGHIFFLKMWLFKVLIVPSLYFFFTDLFTTTYTYIIITIKKKDNKNISLIKIVLNTYYICFIEQTY
jgi:hypothetical protein